MHVRPSSTPRNSVQGASLLSRRRRTHSLTHHTQFLTQHYIIYYVPSDFQGRTINPSPCSAADPRVMTFVQRLIATARRSLMGSRSIRPGRTRNTTVETANRRNKIHHWAHPNPTEPAAVMARHSRECVLVFHSTDPLAGALVLRYPLRAIWYCTNPLHGNV